MFFCVISSAKLASGQNEIQIHASDGRSEDRFGYNVSIYEETAIVGAHRDDDNGFGSGTAFVFHRNQGGPDNWGQVRKLIGDSVTSGDLFGTAVSIYGDFVLIGAPHDGHLDIDNGAAYLFKRGQIDENNWHQVKKLTADDAAVQDALGISLALHGETAIISAVFNDDHGPDSGSVYIFSRNHGGPDNWGQVKKITADDAEPWDHFGLVALHDDIALVGAHNNDDDGQDSGSAYIFYRNQGGPDNWGQIKKLTADDAEGGDLFGVAVSISGNTAVVGAMYDEHVGPRAGSAYVFYRNAGGPDNWGQIKKLVADDAAAHDVFGRIVSVDGNTIVVGSLRDDDNGEDSGSAYVFSRNAGGSDNWGQVDKLTATDAVAGAHFGVSISLRGARVLIGADYAENDGIDSGSAYIFAGGAIGDSLFEDGFNSSL